MELASCLGSVVLVPEVELGVELGVLGVELGVLLFPQAAHEISIMRQRRIAKVLFIVSSFLQKRYFTY